tara:strand:- start:1692 stop:1907 length:216 start_codon:yes stop_codon:yes gene_type:complete
MKVGDLVRYKWMKMWDKYSSPIGKHEWHERYDKYYGVIYKIDETRTNIWIKFPDKTTALKATEVEVVSECQ